MVYWNPAATDLIQRLRSTYRIELDVMLRDHLMVLAEPPVTTGVTKRERTPVITMLKATTGEPFYIHVIPVANRTADVAVSVRSLGPNIEALQRRYRLSKREAEVAALVLRGQRNADIASKLGISPTTTKKHLTRIFDKVGVDTRSQLQMHLS